MKKILFIFIIGILLLTPVFSASAAFKLVPDCAKDKDGEAGFCCALEMANNIKDFVLGISGSIALLLFVYAGFLWITSAGTPEKVKQGKRIMAQTVIAMLIIVVAWFAVNFVITSLAGNPDILRSEKQGEYSWYDICKGYKENK